MYNELKTEMSMIEETKQPLSDHGI